MTISTSRLAFSDCFELMDQALADPKGIKIKFAKSGDAWHFRLRMHGARRVDRKDNAMIYEEGHPMCGRSVYDELTVKLDIDDEGYTWVRVEKLSAVEFEVESLSEPERRV